MGKARPQRGPGRKKAGNKKNPSRTPATLGGKIPEVNLTGEDFCRMLGGRIAAAMEMAGFDSAEELSQASKVPRRSITDYIAGKTLPNADYLARIARATLCNPAWLLTGDGDMRPRPDDPAAREEFAEARREMIAAAAQLISALAKLKALVPKEEWAPLEQAMKAAAKAMGEKK